MEEDSELLPGMVRKLKSDGCCPEYEIVCDVDSCPLAEECDLFEQLVTDNKNKPCCPNYECRECYHHSLNPSLSMFSQALLNR